MARRHRQLLTALLAATALAVPALAEPLGPDGFKMGDERLRPGLYPAAPVPAEFVPAEPGHSPFDIDWSVGLKGSYTSSTTDNTFSSVLSPQFTAIHDGVRANIVIDGSAEIERPWTDDGEIDVTSLRLGIAVVAPINSVTTATANAALALNQQPRTAPGLDPLIAVPPQVLSGTLGAGVERQFGRFNVAVRGDAQRTIYGRTDRRDSGITDNAEQNLWALNSSLRVGFQATPIFEVFSEASLGRDQFDRASAAGIRANATDYALRGGVAGRWGSTFAATASIGQGYHDFEQDGLTDVATQLYDASIVFTPDPTLSLAARINTSVDPVGADRSGTARISHTATADLAYTANSWLRFRATADWGYAEFTGSAETERRYGAGTGADYTVNSHTALSADYGYDHRDNSVTGVVDTHKVSLGVTLKR